jgi:hypothetical protein
MRIAETQIYTKFHVTNMVSSEVIVQHSFNEQVVTHEIHLNTSHSEDSGFKPPTANGYFEQDVLGFSSGR